MFKEVYGFTTQIVTVGLSAVAGVSMQPNVVRTMFKPLTGSSLFFSGVGVAHATMFVSGAPLASLQAVWTDIYGPAGIQFAAGGATATISVIHGLGQGYAGQY